MTTTDDVGCGTKRPMLWKEEMEREKEPCVGLFAMKRRQEFPGVLPQGKAVWKVAPSSTSIYGLAASEVSGQFTAISIIREVKRGYIREGT